MTAQLTGDTVIESLARSLESAAKYNPSDVVHPNAILWTDHDSQWQPIIPRLRRLMPQLLTFGEYEPDQRTGPAIWLRCVVDRSLEHPELPDGTAPIIYLPGISRQELRAVQECPDGLKPLVELQYRGVCWIQKNGKDWTVEAFLVAEDGGLALDVARDAVTRRSMLGALTELATTSVERLRGRHLEAEDFDKLFSDDPAKDLLLWLSDPEAVKSGWNSGRWSAFKSRCKADLKFDPDKDGELVAAELLGKQEGSWGSVWERFAESPALYPGVYELLRKAMPSDLFVEQSSWPQNNEKEETALRQALLELGNTTPSAAREQILALEKIHGVRRGWVWAKLDQAPLANALVHLAVLAEHASSKLGGSSVADMAKLYVDAAWEVDTAALSAMAAVKSSADAQGLSKALNAIYRPWLESAAEHLQGLAEKEPIPGHDGQGMGDVLVESGGLILFADGLRFDISQHLAELMRAKGWSVTMSTRWAGLPTVTATAKPAVSPVAEEIKGLSLGEDFLPMAADTEKPLTTDRFRKLLSAAGYQYVGADEMGDPSGRAWTENGELDKLGHSLQGKLAGRVEDQVDLLLERIESLLDAGWREIRVVTDHGWLWLPGGLPKVDLPKYLTASRWTRCAAIKGGSKVEVPTVRWHWNEHERVAVAPGIACFGAGNEYAHGGLSLQESLVPVIRVTAGASTVKTAVKLAVVTWAGLRCRVQIESAQSGLSIDLRTKVNDPGSSVSKVRPVDAKGTASLLVADDELEGTPAAVVVLDTSGHVIVKQSTIIGGED
ncbi:MAG: BREX-1 system phosphatase PglZ type B [Candidatus Thiodiazotropha sp. (ex Lucinoma borealis)]|nr:BREX-1 system phosphatase PglZ type B [Candidatus Thiodiazotropha sp. (ex Lucinoma borealis)]